MSIGIDLGSTGVRAAAATSSSGAPGAVSTWNPPTPPGSVIRCDLTGHGAEFRTAKDDLGGPAQGAGTLARTGLLAELGAVRDWAAGHGPPAPSAVVAVPAGFTSPQRSAIRAEAAGAGFAAVDLINDSVAVALANSPLDAPARTMLVVGSGYRSTEVAVIRSMRGRVRVLGHLVGGDMSGAGLDADLMHQWLDSLPLRVRTSVGEWGPSELGRLRDAAEQIKVRLAAGETVLAPWPPWADEETGADANTPGVPFDATAFETRARSCAASTGERVFQLLQETDVAISDVDLVLLNGGTATIPAVADELATVLGVEVVLTEAAALARGAALHCARLRPSTGRAADDLGVAVRLPQPLHPAGGVSLAGRGHHALDPVAAARERWQQGKPGEAADDLRDLMRRAQGLLDEIERETAVDGSTAGPPRRGRLGPAQRARKHLRLAEAKLTAGRLAEAVAASHQAWDQDRADEAVFRRMLDIHLQVAQEAVGPEHYADAIQWLRCAHWHNRDAVDVLDALVTRMVGQARHHAAASDREAASELLDQALELDPDHPVVKDMQAELG